MVAVLGHLGVWAGLYALAAFMCFSQLAGLPAGAPLPRWEAMLCVFLTATGVYSLDRVKMSSRWLDPADVLAQPERYRFLTPRSVRVRVMAAVVLVAAALVGYTFHPLAAALVALSALGTVIYAPMPRRRTARIKDRLWLKNLYVAIGMTLFCALVAMLARPEASVRGLPEFALNSWAALVLSFAAVGFRILFDAALCDIDDEPTDRRFGTDTFATRLGGKPVWHWAGFGRLAIAAGLVVARPLPVTARIGWAAAMVLGMIALRWRHPVRIRDTVDLRFLPEACFVAIVLWISQSSHF